MLTATAHSQLQLRDDIGAPFEGKSHTKIPIPYLNHLTNCTFGFYVLHLHLFCLCMMALSTTPISQYLLHFHG